MTSARAIDVLLPVYNAEATLALSLESLSNQSFTNFRIIAINDGSTDGSLDILRAFAGHDERIDIVNLANGGIVRALNTGLSHVTAPIVARLDADDLCDPDRLDRQYAFLNRRPDHVAVGGRVEHIDEHGRTVHGLPHPGDPEEADPWRVPAREPYIVHPFLMARASAMRSAGGYRHVPHSEDSDLFWRLRDHGKLHNLSAVVGQYRLHSGSISGASIVGGRVMAIGSQLGALAARRRERGLPDRGFPTDLIARLAEARTLGAMGEVVAAEVDVPERDRFRLATGMKLLELSAYRPYEIEESDANFIGTACRTIGALQLPPGNATEINWHLTQTAARLLRSGRLGAARRLLPRSLWPKAVAKAVLRA